jgi:Mrp family chromosome partitioning ATPase
VADSALLARLCDATLLVVLADSTRGDVLRRAKEQLEQSGAKLLGVVLNKVSTGRDGYYYYQRYYYSGKEGTR